MLYELLKYGIGGEKMYCWKHIDYVQQSKNLLADMSEIVFVVFILSIGMVWFNIHCVYKFINLVLKGGDINV